MASNKVIEQWEMSYCYTFNVYLNISHMVWRNWCQCVLDQQQCNIKQQKSAVFALDMSYINRSDLKYTRPAFLFNCRKLLTLM